MRSLDIRRTKRSFVTAAVSSFTATGAPLGWHVLKLWRCVAHPPPRVAMFLYLVGESVAGEARRGDRRGVSHLPPGHRAAEDFRWADRDE